MGIASDLSEIKEVSDTIVANKVSKFCYTDTAYDNNDANGVSVYNVNNEQNIPTSSPSVMKVNDTVVTKGWRARASSITRMFMNHMLGRLSYNVNKLSDMMNNLLVKLNANLDANGGLATVNAQGKVSLLDNVANTGDSDTPAENGTDKFTTGGAYNLKSDIDGKAPINHASNTTDYGVASKTNYGHVRFANKGGCYFSASATGDNFTLDFSEDSIYVFCNPSGDTISEDFNSSFQRTIIVISFYNGGTSFQPVTLTGTLGSGFSARVNIRPNEACIIMEEGVTGTGLLCRM